MNGFTTLQLSVVILALSCTQAIATDTGRPADLKIQPLDHTSPCGAYLGGWGGVDPYGRAIEIWVEKIDSACNVQMVYAWGNSPGSRIASEKGNRRLNAVIRDSSLLFELKDFGAKGVYNLAGDSLKGIFTNRQGTPIHMALMKISTP